MIIFKLSNYIEKLNEVFILDDKHMQIKYLQELVDKLEKNNSFTNTIDSIMNEYYLKNKNENENENESVEEIELKNVNQNSIKKRLNESENIS